MTHEHEEYQRIVDALPDENAPIGLFVEQIAELAGVPLERTRVHLNSALTDGVATKQLSKVRHRAYLWRLG